MQLLSGGNTVIALARDPSSKNLVAIKDKNLHILKADVTDPDALKVPGRSFTSFKAHAERLGE